MKMIVSLFFVASTLLSANLGFGQDSESQPKGPRNLEEVVDIPRPSNSITVQLLSGLFHTVTLGAFSGPTEIEYVKAKCVSEKKDWEFRFFQNRECGAECFYTSRTAAIAKATEDGQDKIYDYGRSDGFEFTDATLSKALVAHPEKEGVVIEMTCSAEIMNTNSMHLAGLPEKPGSLPKFEREDRPKVVESLRSVKTEYY